uniref:protein-tyrosine-phosphatase n=1 Tax=Setaria digitata TaxID=48799 RepID=A0A915PYG9_9BILA
MSENDSNQNLMVSEILPKDYTAADGQDTNQSPMGAESYAEAEFISADCKQKPSFISQTSGMFNPNVLRSSLLDRTNIPIPPPQVHFPSTTVHFSFSDSPSTEKTSDYSKCIQPISSTCLSGRRDSSSDLVRVKQVRRVRRCSDFKKHRSKNMRISSKSNFGKLYNLLPTTRHSETVSEHSSIEKCRGDDEDDFENLENEFSFRAHLQGTSHNSLISPSLPSTSTPNKLESRYKKRRMSDEMEDNGSAKKAKDDQMEESGSDRMAADSFEEGMDVDVTGPLREDRDSAIEDENGSDDDRSSDIENGSRAFHRSHSSSFLETSDVRDPRSPQCIRDFRYELDILRNPDVPSTAFACISAETLADLLMSMTMEQFLERFLLIDCRYPFEYEGGHIRGAYNLYDPAVVEEAFYPSDIELRAKLMMKKPIFYCEFSQKRAPSMAYELRALDRKLNVGRYPMVDYPEMYLLQYGYRNFYLRYSSAPDLLEPNGYVKMSDKAHLQELRNYKFHRIRTVASVYHTLARDRYNRQPREELNTSTMEVDQNMKTPPRRILPMRLFISSPESPSQFPSTPKSRPLEDRGREVSGRSTCRRLFSDDDFKGNDPDPGPSTSNTI